MLILIKVIIVLLFHGISEAMQSGSQVAYRSSLEKAWHFLVELFDYDSMGTHLKYFKGKYLSRGSRKTTSKTDISLEVYMQDHAVNREYIAHSEIHRHKELESTLKSNNIIIFEHTRAVSSIDL